MDLCDEPSKADAEGGGVFPDPAWLAQQGAQGNDAARWQPSPHAVLPDSAREFLESAALTEDDRRQALRQALGDRSDATEFDAKGLVVDDEGLRWIVMQRPKLTTLNLSGSRLTAEGLKLLHRLEELTDLYLDNGSSGLDGDALCSLPVLRSLEMVFLNDLHLSVAAVSHLTRFPKLNDLSFKGGRMWDQHVEALMPMIDRLSHLALGDDVTDEGMRFLVGGTFADIDVVRTKVTPVGLAILSRAKVRGLRCRGDDLSVLNRFTHLAALAIEGGDARAGLRHLPRNLLSLELVDVTGLDDAELAALEALPRLYEVYVEGCTGFSREALETLEKRMAKSVIAWESAVCVRPGAAVG